jgi:dTDP-4-dehydrorhamnose reductase
MTLIIGGDSMIGAALATELKMLARPVTTTSRRGLAGLQLDLAAPSSSWFLPPCRSAVVCAAMTSIDGCERQPELARRINTEAVDELSRRLSDNGSHLIFLSTNLVFDGSMANPGSAHATCPTTLYGELKAEAEEAVRAANLEASAILRLTKVLGPGHQRLASWESALAAGRAIEAFGDMPLAPVGLGRVTAGLASMLENRAVGTFHLSAAHDVTWFDLARRLATARGMDARMVVETSAFSRGLHPPRHSALGMGEAELQLGLTPDDPQRALEEALG